MSGDPIVLVYTLYGDAAAAEAAVRACVEEGLAACANMLAPATSVYAWQGQLERQTEYPVLFKTTEARRGALMAHIAAAHSYDVPAIMAWTADAAPGFAQWVGEMTGG